ncbi:response regulator transcription factor [Rhizobium sp. Root1220]|uniref:response regulator transcription factor n=1 Tax=Rhizobium sp. Root1220 TaxID=1736432 RepID=UPI0006F52C81|nr:response regulator transcription factor [Rhizobium sp. Root1220]KQV70454.1 hypothetical protein ASC90_10175 [Rhizobium sp. Root1220]
MAPNKSRISAICAPAGLSETIRSSLLADPSMCFVDTKRNEESIPDFISRTLPTVVICEVASESGLVVGRAVRRLSNAERTATFKVIYAVDPSIARRVDEIYVDGMLNIVFTNDDYHQIYKAISLVSQGGHYISASVFNSLSALDIRSFHSRINTGPEEGERISEGNLSAREEVVLKLFAYGFSTKEIAAEIHVSTKTVETYKARGADKLSLSSRASIVKYGASRGWFDIYST